MYIPSFMSVVKCPTCKHEKIVKWEPAKNAIFHMQMHYICSKCRTDFHVQVEIPAVNFTVSRQRV